MKTSVRVPYLYLTTDPSIVDRLNQIDGSIPTLSILNEVQFIIGPEMSDKLLNFELNYNYEGQKYGLATIEFLDIDGDLETKFIHKSSNMIFSNYYSKLKQNPQTLTDFEEFTRFVETDKTPKFFLGFGISEDIRDWSGPYICSILRTDMMLDSNNLKRISVQFQLTDSSFELKTHDPDIHKGYISDIVARNMPQINVVAAGGVVMNVMDFVEANPTDVLTSAMSDYLQVISDTKNTIVILPDLSYFKNLEISKQRQKDIKDANDSYFSWYRVIPATEKNFNSFKKYDTSPARFSQKINFQQYQDLVYFPSIRKFYKKFGVDIVILPIEEYGSTNWVRATPSIDADIAWFEEGIYLRNLVQSKVLIQISTSTEQSQEDTGQSNNSKPDFYIPIRKMQEGFNNFKITDSLNAFNTNLTLHYENNPNIIKLWMELGILPQSTSREVDSTVILTSDQIRTHWIYGHSTPLSQQITQRDECPIDPALAEKFNKIGYRKELAKTCKYYIKGSSFGELDSSPTSNQLITDVFKLNGEERNIETPMTIFTCNTNNANVISFNLATYPSYVGIFNYGINTLNEQLATDSFSELGPIDRKTLIAEAINKFDKDLTNVDKELIHYFFEDNLFKGLAADVAKRREAPVYVDNPRLSNLPTLEQRSKKSYGSGGAVTRSGFDDKIRSTTEASKVYAKVDAAFTNIEKNEGFVDVKSIENTKKMMEAVFSDLAKKEDLEGVDSKLRDLINQVSPDRLSKFLCQIYILNQNARSPKIFNYTRDPLYLQKQIYDYMSNSYLELNLKTLPFFHLDGSHFGKYCTFLHHELIALPLTHNPERNWSFLTGMYIINGFRHVISPTECYTEVALKKAPLSIQEDTTASNEVKPEVQVSEDTNTAKASNNILEKVNIPTPQVNIESPTQDFDINDPRIPENTKQEYLTKSSFKDRLKTDLDAAKSESPVNTQLVSDLTRDYYSISRDLTRLKNRILTYTQPSVQSEINKPK
jgi:hypothetical protein